MVGLNTGGLILKIYTVKLTVFVELLKEGMLIDGLLIFGGGGGVVGLYLDWCLR